MALESAADDALVRRIVERIGERVGALVDVPLEFTGAETERATARIAGAGCAHISFRFEVAFGGEGAEGCVLFPVHEVTSLASYLLMLPQQLVLENRRVARPDAFLHDAIFELGMAMTRTIDALVREESNGAVSMRFSGCQGVRADVRPKLDYVEGSELLVGHARGRLAEFDPFELTVMLPGEAVDFARRPLSARRSA